MNQLCEANPNQRRGASHVRFNAKEYTRIEEDSISTGQSVPTLLKERYLKAPRPLPLMSNADLSKFMGEFARIANHLGALARQLNSGIREGFVPQLDEIQHATNKLLTFMVGRYCRCKRVS